MDLRDPSLLRQDNFINGRWQSAASRFAVTNPANGETIAEVAVADDAAIETAIAGAEEAFGALRKSTAEQRSGWLWAFEAEMARHEEDLAQILTAEQGKPLAEARGELRYARSFLRWFAEEARRLYGETIPSPKVDQRLLVFRQGVGVAAAITPWNFPSAMVTRKLGAAMAAGCSMVLKPAEATPLSALALAELARRAGFPEGSFQVLCGDTSDAPRIGQRFCEDTRIRKLSFTGSTRVGKLLLRQCADTVKKVSLELGGNAPFVVFEDADLDAAVEGCMAAKFRNGGQTCVAANRILVHRSVHEDFVEKLTAAMSAMKVGEGTQEDVQVGPMITPAAVAKVMAHIEDAKKKGASVLLGGQGLGGNFVAPTLLTGVTLDTAMANEETFGPVAGIIAFDTEDEAIGAANDTPAGLAAYFYTRDIGRVFRVSEALDYGMVGVNSGMISTTVAPFGGVKESGLGREGSRHGLEDWTELKYVAIGL